MTPDEYQTVCVEKKRKMNYSVKDSLATRGPIDQLDERATGGSLLIGESAVAQWEAVGNGVGHDEIALFPAYHCGEKAWVLRKVWISRPGYSCTGLTAESILCFREGVDLLLGRDAFEHLWQ